MNRIGFVVNPYAGMGGAVGLKGTDGCVKAARSLGAEPLSPSRAVKFLSGLNPHGFYFLTAAGDMGENELRDAGISSSQVIFTPSSPETGAEDTRAACELMVREGVRLIVFCGGDGTARDVFSVTGKDIPILGIPAGVKIYSGVFSTTPETGAEVLNKLDEASLTEAEVMDVDEEQYRAGILTTRLFGIASMPYISGLCQSCKEVSFGDETRMQDDIARFITGIMRPDTLYLLGAGSTTGAIANRLGLNSTLLGVDAVYQGTLVAQDLNEEAILRLVDQYENVRIILSPIGAQGFVLGRGNQQISRRVLKKTGTGALIVVATPAKLQHTPVLYIDTGDPEMNTQFGETLLVICGMEMAQRVKLS
ncbi:ATP-NAD kinase family protein [Methanospirillum lacunae]|uniref:ATP-NAD kinase n=1 Tax=Methanospirillum lacunae TaxID=668570 RepID=A0A2V2MW71_9EURY|nr:ATP-NAD kinase family protein [Methanospirillum lacunae]PWR71629.1 ATP-NAD kinase [Methanospirillum lacunae]